MVRTAGALPVVKMLCDRLGVAEAVDRFCRIRSVAEYSHGQVVEALVANRLTHPRPLCAFEDWGERFAVAEVLGIAPVKLNDDRLGRTLDALAAHVDEVLNLLARRAVERFGIGLAELHWDLTQLSFTGAYDEQEQAYAQVKRGHGPQREIKRQMQAGFWVSADGAVPVRAQAFDGNQQDVAAVAPALERLDALRQSFRSDERPLVIGDSKLLSAANVAAFTRRRLRFLCPHAKDARLQRRLAALEETEFAALAYAAERHRGGPPRYYATEAEIEVGGQRLRALFCLSLDDQAVARQQRARRLTRAEQELARLNRSVPRYTKTAAALEHKARALLERRKVASLVRLSLLEQEGKPQARIERDERAIAEAMRLDGRYCLVTNDRHTPADELFAAYKRQHLIESRFTDLKGPIKVRPLFLHTNRRIAALLAVISLALLLYGLIERQVRRALDTLTSQQRTLLNRRTGRATGRKILDQLSDLAAVRIRDGPTQLAQPRPVQQLLLQLLQTP